MKTNEMTMFDAAVAVAVACRADERPDSGTTTAVRAAQYVGSILELLLGGTAGYSVQPLQYPVASKIPLVIDISGVGKCLYWYYPADSDREVAAELAGAMTELAQDAVHAAEQGGVA